MKDAYYNEFDPKAAAWLRELIKAGLIADGDVDERSITDVKSNDLQGYTQCHFFAGIGGWSYALRLAGWPDNRPVWTGSCPCQPFSAAGKQMGRNDPRHLWPAFRRLINKSRPSVVFGEQVASAAGRVWLSGVFSNLETMGYAAAGADLCAASASPEVAGWIWIPDETEGGDGSWIPASAGPPHIRQRLYWMADANSKRLEGRAESNSSSLRPEFETSRRDDALRCSDARGMADALGGNAGAEWQQRSGKQRQQQEDDGTSRLEYSASLGRVERRPESGERSALGGCWDVFDIVHCTDGKARRFEPGSFPLVARLPGGVGPGGDPSISYAKACAEFRVPRLKGYGNSIIPELAAEFIKASFES